MLGVFKKTNASNLAREQTEELQALIDTAREERVSLNAMLTRIEVHGKELTRVNRSIQDVNDRATGAQATLGELMKRMSAIEVRSHDFEKIDSKIQALDNSVDQAAQTTADFEALKKEQSSFNQLRQELQQTQKRMQNAAQETAAVKGEFDSLREAASSLRGEQSRVEDALRATREESAATIEKVKDVEKKLVPLAEVNELSKAAGERLASLNVLSEHVASKIKVLENQKHSIEHAVVESNRLGELMWNMEIQIQKLDEGSKRAAKAEETLDRTEQTVAEIASQLERAENSKSGLEQDLAKLDKTRAELSEFVNKRAERLALDRTELNTLCEQVKTLQDTIAGFETNLDELGAKGTTIKGIAQNVEEVLGQMGKFNKQAEELQGRQEALGALHERLDQVDELGAQIGRQQETLLRGRQQLDDLRSHLDEFYKAQAEIAKTGDQIGAERAAFETFLARAQEFQRDVPDLESRLDAITSKLSAVDEGMQKAATVVTVVDEIDSHVERIASYQQLVEKVDTRLNGLSELSITVDTRIEEQIGRRSEVDALKSVCDGLELQIGDARPKLEAVRALQQKLLPLASQMETLKTESEKAHSAFKEVKLDQSELASQEKRLTELMDGIRGAAASIEERFFKQVQGLTEEVARGAVTKDELIQELGRIQGRQHEVAEHALTSEKQIKRVDTQIKQLDKRHSELAVAEKKIEAFQGRLDDLESLNNDVEQKIQAVTAREAFVGSVKKEVDKIHQISQRSRVDLQHVADHRNEVDQLRNKLEAVLTGFTETEERIAAIEARKKIVDEVQLKTSVIGNVLEDVRVNLEMLSEQRSVVDHVVESMAQFEETVQRGRATLKALQTERELAERIESGIKRLRTTGGESRRK